MLKIPELELKWMRQMQGTVNSYIELYNESAWKRTFTGVLNQSEQKYDTWLLTCQRIVKILFDPKKYIR